MKISVVIATYNRALLLQKLLGSLEKQIESTSNIFEVLVIDNNSNDNTKTITQEFVERNDNFQYIFEQNQGVSFARNRGILESSGEYIAFLDDECVVSEDWINKVILLIEKNHPDVFGGPYYASFDGPKPIWFKDEYGTAIHTKISGRFLKGVYLSAGNLIIRRDILIKIGGFNVDLGPKGSKIRFAEECVLQNDIREQYQDAVFYYSHDIAVHHLVRPEKYSISRRIREMYYRGRSLPSFLHEESESSFILSIKIIKDTFLIVLLLVGMVFRDREKFPYWQNFVYEPISDSVLKIGRNFSKICMH